MFSQVATLILVEVRGCSLGSLTVTLASTVPDTPIVFQQFTEFLYNLYDGVTNITEGAKVLPLTEINVLNPSDNSLKLNISSSTTLCNVFDNLRPSNNYTCPFNETLPSPAVPACLSAAESDTVVYNFNIIFNSSETVLTSILRLSTLYTLQDYFNNFTIGCANLTISSITISNLDVDISMVVRKGEITQSSLAAALLRLARLNVILDINGIATPVLQIKVLNGDGSVSIVNPTSDLCTVFEQIKSCEDMSVCIDRSNQASCVPSATGDDLAVIIGLGVGVPVFIVVVSLISIMLVYRNRIKKRQRYIPHQRSPQYSVFAQGILPKFHSWGRQPYQFPDQWADAESRSSSSSSDQPTSRGRLYDDYANPKSPVSAPFYLSSWDDIHNSGEEFKIRRPKIKQSPDDVYTSGNGLH
ncbi:uncharacterized protein LOC117322534 [Pecten maximus]|uniref:uncharacterized protein LOC117322534 n=1 Tax=Pecten maximus TaxID=6579 RepID=UPI00145811AB|nr:uncharacterized protein LOC117322534 [Pecten maximus]